MPDELRQSAWLNALAMSDWSGCWLRGTTESIVSFRPNLLIFRCGCSLHEANDFAAVGLAKYSSHESRYPSSVTLRCNGRSLRLIKFLQRKSWDSLDTAHHCFRFRSPIVIGLTFSILLSILRESTRYR